MDIIIFEIIPMSQPDPIKMYLARKNRSIVSLSSNYAC